MADFRGFSLGRLPAKFTNAPLLHTLASFGIMPAVVAPVDYSTLVGQWPMLLNDQLGDCTAAGLLHMMQCWRAKAMKLEVPDDGAALDIYSATSGYLQGQPDTDRGANMNDVLSYAQKNLSGVPYNNFSAPEWIRAYAYIQHDDLAHVTRAIANFVGVYAGVMLRQSQMTQEVWDADGSEIIGGHCIYVVGFNLQGPIVISWGKRIQTTWAWWNQAIEEAWVCMNYDFAGIGPAYEQLVAEAKAVTS